MGVDLAVVEVEVFLVVIGEGGGFVSDLLFE
jgi:hypothetical protein